MSKSFKIEKMTFVQNPEKGEVVGFQMIRYTLTFFGKVIEGVLDTKIMQDGSQVVIDGDGYLKEGTNINTLGA